MKKLIIGTRGSRLALAQAEEVKSKLQTAHPELEVELRIIKTTGDKRLDLSLNASGDKGLFTKELEVALHNGEIDCAVHSLKDLPVELNEGTILSAILRREDPRDVLLGGYTFETLPQGAIIGTSSPRRAAQLLEQRPDLNIKEIRGNVESRIAKLEAKEYDAIVMARAGLKRLGLEERISYTLDTLEMVPAPGQAAIAVQQLEGREEVAQYLASIHCPHSARCVEIERYILHQHGGGCAVPFACLCEEVVTKEPFSDVQEEGYFITLYNLYDEEQTLKALIVDRSASNETIWEHLQDKTVPISRARAN